DRCVGCVGCGLKIACIVTNGGPYAMPGNLFLKAVQMAKNDLLGTKYQYQLVLVDIGTDESTARVAIERALRVDRVDAIVGGISRFGLLTKPLASAARIPHSCVCSVTAI